MGLGIVRAPPRSHADINKDRHMFAGIRFFFWACCFSKSGGQNRLRASSCAGLTRASISFAKRLFAKADGLPGHKRVTRVFNALCPALTACEGRVRAPFAHPTVATPLPLTAARSNA